MERQFYGLQSRQLKNKRKFCRLKMINQEELLVLKRRVQPLIHRCLNSIKR